MKKLLVILLLSVFFIPAVYAGEAKPIEMKLGHFAADAHPGNLASKMFADAVEKRTNGAIKVTIYPNNALGSPPEVLEQNILGAVDMSLPTQGQLGKYSKKFNCVMLPFVFNDYAQADKVLDIPAADLPRLGLEAFAGRFDPGDLAGGWLNSLKTGIATASVVTTVSPSFAREMLTPERGMALDATLRARGDLPVGILNGIGDDWDPLTDPLLPYRYEVGDLVRRLDDDLKETRRELRAARELTLGGDLQHAGIHLAEAQPARTAAMWATLSQYLNDVNAEKVADFGGIGKKRKPASKAVPGQKARPKTKG